VEDTDVDGRIILKFMFNKSVEEGGGGTDLTQDTDKYRVTVNAVMEHTVTIKYREFLEQMKNYQLLRKDSAPWSWL